MEATAGRSRCTVCRLANIGEINGALVKLEPASDVATRLGIPHRTLQRHAQKCLGKTIAAAIAKRERAAVKLAETQQAVEEISGQSVMVLLWELLQDQRQEQARLRELSSLFSGSKDWKEYRETVATTARLGDAYLRALEFWAKVDGTLANGPTINILVQQQLGESTTEAEIVAAVETVREVSGLDDHEICERAVAALREYSLTHWDRYETLRAKLPDKQRETTAEARARLAEQWGGKFLGVGDPRPRVAEDPGGDGVSKN
jgi:hypothetical protein